MYALILLQRFVMKQSVILRGSLSFAKRPGFYAQNVVDSIRSWFKGEIIVSTWEDQVESARNLIGIDKVVVSKDPGDGPIQQMQRQVNSYWAGVNACSGDEIMVTRTDILHFRDLFEFIGIRPHVSPYDMRCFDDKIVIGNIMTIHPESNEANRTFRACDWFQVGKRSDIERWIGITQELAQIPLNELEEHWGRHNICTEKLWFILVLNKYSKHRIDWRNTTAMDDLAWPALLDNFVLLDQITTARSINVNWAFQPQRLHCYVTEHEFNKKYLELCA